MEIYPYSFPVEDFRQAISVLKPTFDINKYPDDNLYIDFSPFRSEESLSTLMASLGIINGVFEPTPDYVKILYTGHNGCGKSTELIRINQLLNDPQKYFAIYIDIQDSLQISSFESEDLFVLLITKLVEALEKEHIPHANYGLNQLADEWVSNKEVVEEIQDNLGTETGVTAEAGFSLWNFFSIKSNLKTLFSFNSKTSEVIRKKIKEKQGEYIFTFNELLTEITEAINNKSKGREILFILDGIEKLKSEKYDTYLQTFFRDARLIQNLNCNIICCVPIESLYDLRTNHLIDGLYDRFTLPIIRVNEKTLPLFESLITNRIKKDLFIDEEALKYCVEQSGGNPRQLLKIVEKALYSAINKEFKITKAIAKKACHSLGLDLRQMLTPLHFDLLNNGKYDGADPNILEMLYSLVLMEYNGNTRERLPNPLLIPFIKRND